jgi:crossover junction endodeoxyribonuclease RuvC
MTNSSVRILGIDPGSRLTGYGVIECDGSRQRWLAHGRIRCDDGGPLPERLLRIFSELEQLIREYRPREAAVESVFVNRNAASAIVLGQARGAAICALAGAGLSLAEYAPAQVKSAIVGSGRAEKVQVQHMVRALLHLQQAPPADAADALAVALCHAQLRGAPPVRGSRVTRGRWTAAQVAALAKGIKP